MRTNPVIKDQSTRHIVRVYLYQTLTHHLGEIMKRQVFFLASILTLLFCGKLCGYNTQAYFQLDAIAKEEGTDKSSKFHNYTKIYADYFANKQKEPLKFVEIGIYKGDSMAMWQRYFPNAELHFLDVTFDRLNKSPGIKTHLHLVNQEDERALIQFAEAVGGNFDIIIDDGGHTMNQQLVSFKTLFPYLKSGGLYIIEDLHTSYWQPYGGSGYHGSPKSNPYTTSEFLKQLVDDVNYWGAYSGCADKEKMPLEEKQKLSSYKKDIYSMHFYDSLCVIIKNQLAP